MLVDMGSVLSAAVNIVLDAGTGGTISVTDVGAAYDSTVGIRFNTNGTIDKGTEINNAGITWASYGTWIIPTGEASIDFDVRFTSFNGAGGGDWTTEAAADDAWVDLGTARTWLMNSTSLELITFTCDFEVRDGGGAPPATAAVGYTFSIDNTA